MEAIERASAEECDLQVFYCTREEMERTGPTIDPAEIIVPQVTKYVPDLRIEWVEGFDLLAKRPTYVPLNAVICPYQPPEGRPVFALCQFQRSGLRQYEGRSSVPRAVRGDRTRCRGDGSSVVEAEACGRLGPGNNGPRSCGDEHPTFR